MEFFVEAIVSLADAKPSIYCLEEYIVHGGAQNEVKEPGCSTSRPLLVVVLLSTLNVLINVCSRVQS